MLKRTRSAIRTEGFGSVYERSGGSLVLRADNFPFRTAYKSIEDWHQKKRREDGTLPLSDLVIQDEKVLPIQVTMEERFNGNLNQVFNNVPLNCAVSKDWGPAGGWSALELSDTEYVAKLLARSNPFAYTVSVPIMIFELLEAATLLRLSTANFLTLGGSAYLNNEFGIKPFMSDIKALHSITSAIESKIKDLNRLIKRGGLRKKVFLGRKSVTEEVNPYQFPGWSSFSKSFYYQIQMTYTSKVWGTCRWRPNRLNQINIDKLVSVNNAIRIVLDLKQPDWSTIWEMIPFSWLVDYFTNIGDSLQAVEKSDVVEPYDICIMRTRTLDTRLLFVNASWHNSNEGLWRYSTSANTGRYTCTNKYRSVKATPSGFSSLLAYGFMNKAQAQNLTALLLSLARHRR